MENSQFPNQNSTMEPIDLSIQQLQQGKYCFQSELYRIRMLRDVYKQETDKNFEEISAQFEEQRIEKQNEAAKGELLLEHTKMMLECLDEQRDTMRNVMKETDKRLKTLFASVRKSSPGLTDTKTAMEKLLSELNR